MKKGMVALLVGIVIVSIFATGTYYFVSHGRGESIRVLAAGSLAVPFQKIAKVYEDEYGVKVYIETAGSIETVKKVSELGIKADVVAVADYRAIENYLMPKYTDWYVKFAKNELVIVYTEKSKYSSEISANNWMNILMKKDTRIGFSSPNDDPCGYRAVMMFYLAQLKYHTHIFQNLVENNTGIRVENGTIIVPNDASLLNSQGRVFIKQKSVALLGDLETGNIDYAIEYLSVAKQHGLKYIRLPDEINLSNASLLSWYENAKIKLADGKVIHGDAINYGITVPNNAPHRDYAYKFVNLVLGEKGKNILTDCGQTPINVPVGNIPAEIRSAEK